MTASDNAPNCMIFGDSRTFHICTQAQGIKAKGNLYLYNATGKDGNHYYAYCGKGYDWFKNNIKTVAEHAQKNGDEYIVIRLGVNDLAGSATDENYARSMAKKYAETAKQLAKLSGKKVIFCSIEPVRESYGNDMTKLQKKIKVFNEEIQKYKEFGYIDTYNQFYDKINATPDQSTVGDGGIHYNNNFNKQLSAYINEQTAIIAANDNSRTNVAQNDDNTNQSNPASSTKPQNTSNQAISSELEDIWVKRIKLGEGFLPTEKKDPTSGVDIGYGHSLTYNGGWDTVNKIIGAPSDNRKITEQQAITLCKHDLKGVYKELDKNFPWWRNLDDESKYVMVDMCYNMGIESFKGFKKTLKAIQNADYETASKEILNSTYAQQTGIRARRNAELMRTGKWYGEIDPKNIRADEKLPTRTGNANVNQGQTPQNDDNDDSKEQTADQMKKDKQNAQAKAKKQEEKIRNDANNTQSRDNGNDKPNDNTSDAQKTSSDTLSAKQFTRMKNWAKRVGLDETAVTKLQEKYGANSYNMMLRALMEPAYLTKDIGVGFMSSRKTIQYLIDTDLTDEQKAASLKGKYGKSKDTKATSNKNVAPQRKQNEGR